MTDEPGYELYGERIAEAYDDLYAELFDVEATVALLKELAGEGPALELAIGTGRVAIPLKESGVEVHGIDISEAMVAKLRAKPGGADITVTMGNFADVPVGGTYPLVYLVFNTIFGLLTQDEQVACFRNVAEHLEPGGRFLIECFVPDLTRFTRNQTLSVIDLDPDHLQIDASRHDPVGQVVRATHAVVREEGIKLYPVEIRYAFPSELDLMARLAGLELEERWAGWRKETFDSGSANHVSVYRRPV